MTESVVWLAMIAAGSCALAYVLLLLADLA